MTLTSAAQKNLIGSLALAMKQDEVAGNIMTAAGTVELPSAFVAAVHKEFDLARRNGLPRGERGDLLRAAEKIFREAT